MTFLLNQAFAALAWLVLTLCVFGPLELACPLERRPPGTMVAGANVMLFFANAVFALPILGAATWLMASVWHHLMPMSYFATIDALPLWLRMVLAMVIGELGFYWGHRWCHGSKLLWNFHSVHHSAEQMTFLVNTRMHPVDTVFTRLCGLVLLIASGLVAPVKGSTNLIVALVLVAGSMWGYLVHANVRFSLRWLSPVLSSPLFHHWHHAPSMSGHNFAAMLPVMDKIFGTYRVPAAWPGAYGLEDEPPGSLAANPKKAPG